jgi:PhnB protein
MKINPYLNFDGDAEEAFNFYKSIFGGEFGMMQRFKEIPEKDKEQGKIKEEEGEKLIHVSLPLGQNVLMASDAPESTGKIKEGNNFSISLEADSKEDAQKFFEGLSRGGKIMMPLADTFWGAYYGMLQDKFGIRWMVSYNYPKE